MKIKLRRLPRRRSTAKLSFTKPLSRKTITHSPKVAAGAVLHQHGLKLLETVKVQWYSFEALRRKLLRICKNRVPLYIHVQLNIPLTTKPGMRMGKGKGKLKAWVGNLRKGCIFLEFGLLSIKDKLLINHVLRSKLPFKTQFCSTAGFYRNISSN